MKPIGKTLITGGAGFIGSHLVDRLMQKGLKVTVIDNLSNGRLENIQRWLNHPNFTFIKGDLKSPDDISEAIRNCDSVFHMAANPEVRVGETDPSVHFQENLVATFNLLEAMRKGKPTRTVIFASTSTVYGEASVLPTPEEYGPLLPISTYGASKLGCEALISSYTHTFRLHALILRLANIVGSRSTIGIIQDFIRKLRANPHQLEILGDGTQKKSYMFVDDCINALLHTTTVFQESEQAIEIFNIGSLDQITAKEIAEIVPREMKLENVRLSFTGGDDDGRGWKGDVKNMCLSLEKLAETGWKPKYSSRQAIHHATRVIIKENDHPRAH